MKNVGIEQSRASNRLASGYRINTAADDAAGLAISETMRAQIRGLDQASRNSQDAQALIQTTEGGMQEITNMLQRVRELTVQASNDTNVTVNLQQIAYEVEHLADEIQAMGNRVQFNTRGVLTMEAGNELHFQIGANSDESLVFDFSEIRVAISDAHEAVSDIGEALRSATEQANGVELTQWIDELQTEIDSVNMRRAELGALVNRLDYTMRSLDISSENLSDAESRVRNADMAREMMRFTMSNVLNQASVSMLSQANQVPNNLLQLLR